MSPDLAGVHVGTPRALGRGPAGGGGRTPCRHDSLRAAVQRQPTRAARAALNTTERLNPMQLWQLVILAVVQGLAELLPVSSSAHVIVAEKLLGLDPTTPQMTLLLVMLHTGTMFAVLAYFWRSWRATYFSSRAAFIAIATSVVIATVLDGSRRTCAAEDHQAPVRPGRLGLRDREPVRQCAPHGRIAGGRRPPHHRLLARPPGQHARRCRRRRPAGSARCRGYACRFAASHARAPRSPPA